MKGVRYIQAAFGANSNIFGVRKIIRTGQARCALSIIALDIDGKIAELPIDLIRCCIAIIGKIQNSIVIPVGNI